MSTLPPSADTPPVAPTVTVGVFVTFDTHTGVHSVHSGPLTDDGINSGQPLSPPMVENILAAVLRRLGEQRNARAIGLHVAEAIAEIAVRAKLQGKPNPFAP